MTRLLWERGEGMSSPSLAEELFLHSRRSPKVFRFLEAFLQQRVRSGSGFPDDPPRGMPRCHSKHVSRNFLYLELPAGCVGEEDRPHGMLVSPDSSAGIGVRVLSSERDGQAFGCGESPLVGVKGEELLGS